MQESMLVTFAPARPAAGAISPQGVDLLPPLEGMLTGGQTADFLAASVGGSLPDASCSEQ